MPDYEPSAYWSRRLESARGLRGTGHVGYDSAYNRWLYRHKGRLLRSELRRLVPRSATLDVGSGTGWVIRQLQRFDIPRIEGCDVTERSVRRVHQKFGVETFQYGFGQEAIPRPDGCFDLVMMIDVVYHVVRDEEWHAGMHELARVLRPGGAVIVTDTFGKSDENRYAHVRLRSRDRWEELAGQTGFEIERIRPWFRWLARSPSASALRVLPDNLRGMTEFGLERMAPKRSDLRRAVLIRTGEGSRV